MEALHGTQQSLQKMALLILEEAAAAAEMLVQQEMAAQVL
jgi:hypothetical protein